MPVINAVRVTGVLRSFIESLQSLVIELFALTDFSCFRVGSVSRWSQNTIKDIQLRKIPRLYLIITAINAIPAVMRKYDAGHGSKHVIAHTILR